MRARVRLYLDQLEEWIETPESYKPERVLTGELLMYATLILASLPSRLSSIRGSLWLDEAWVANSVLAPSWTDMFYYPRWLQPTPPLFLTLLRLFEHVLGASEPALRVLPVVAGLLTIPLLAFGLRKLFGPAASLCGTTLVIVNFWAVKYAQQVKQFGADVFSGALLFLLVASYCRRPDRRNFALLVTGFAVISFFSTPAFFMGPSVMAAILLSRLWGVPSYLRAGRVKIAIAVFGICTAFNYLAFMRPNHNSMLVSFWADRCLNLRHPLTSAQALFGSLGELIVPQVIPAALVLGAVGVVVMITGLVIAVVGAVGGSKKAVIILLVGPLPLATAAVISLMSLYPMLHAPRMLLWALPACAVLVTAAVDPVFDIFRLRVARGYDGPIFYGTALACLTAVLAFNVIVVRHPRPNEQNGEAMRLLQQSMAPSDILFVHRRMIEQYTYYSRLQSWVPQHLSIGNSDWPCCGRNGETYIDSPGVETYAADLRQAIAQVQRPGRVWMFLPWGHNDLTPKIEVTPDLMERESCYERRREDLDQTLVLAYQCR